jgi:hypothetical protein
MTTHTDLLNSLPSTLAARPWTQQQPELPVPVVHMHTSACGEPTADFRTINQHEVYRVGHERLCGACGTALDAQIAFLGDPTSMIAYHMCLGPPLHEACARAALRLCPPLREACARAALRLCPHLLTRERPDTPAPQPASSCVHDPTQRHPERPESWMLGLTHGYDVTLLSMPGQEAPVPMFVPTEWIRLRSFTHTDPDGSSLAGQPWTESAVEAPAPPESAKDATTVTHPTPTGGPSPAEIAALPLLIPGDEPMTIGSYLAELMRLLWDEGSNFSAKRPLGASEWQWPVYTALTVAGYVPGTIDQDGELDDFTAWKQADALIQSVITWVFTPALGEDHRPRDTPDA